MDSIKAAEWERRLEGKTFSGYQIVKRIGNGKSAVVFKAHLVERPNDFVAVKIFDDELIQAVGLELHQQRADLELGLKGHGIDCLIDILDGGRTTVDGHEYHHIMMPFFEGITLTEYFQKGEYDDSFMKKVVRKLVDVTEQLLNDRQIAHRDIKADNIMVGPDGQIMVMDLGVLKHMHSVIDSSHKDFIGTWRYGPPEFILRQEESTPEAWRSINLYQIGCVLYELLNRRKLFEDSEPLAVLIQSILGEVPRYSESCSFELAQLSRDLMTKDWKRRLQACSINRILSIVDSKPKLDPTLTRIEELKRRRLDNSGFLEEIASLQQSNQQRRENATRNATDALALLKSGFSIGREHDLYTSHYVCDLPAGTITRRFQKAQQFEDWKECIIMAQGTLSQGYPANLYWLCTAEADDNRYTKLSVLGLFSRKGETSGRTLNQSIAETVISDLNPPQGPRTNNRPNINLSVVFEGTLDSNSGIVDFIKDKWIQLLCDALDTAAPIVKEAIERQSRQAKGDLTAHGPVRRFPIIIRPKG